MTRTACVAVFLAVLAAPAAASPCSEEIKTLSGTVHDEGKQAIAAGSSGQADAAARGSQGKTGSAGEATQKPPEKSADAGRGADKAQAAKVALDEARTADGEGDQKGCMDAVARARKELGTAP